MDSHCSRNHRVRHLRRDLTADGMAAVNTFRDIGKGNGQAWFGIDSGKTSKQPRTRTAGAGESSGAEARKRGGQGHPFPTA